MALTWSGTTLITDIRDGRAHYPEAAAQPSLRPGLCQVKSLCGQTITRTALSASIGPVCPNCADIRRRARRTASRPVTSQASGPTLAVAADANDSIAVNENRDISPTSHGSDKSSASEWHAFAAVLATMPDLIERLTAAHTPTPDGRRCTACTTPGQGTPHEEWPCIIASLAAEAAARA